MPLWLAVKKVASACKGICVQANLLQPLADPESLRLRLDAVEELRNDPDLQARAPAPCSAVPPLLCGPQQRRCWRVGWSALRGSHGTHPAGRSIRVQAEVKAALEQLPKDLDKMVSGLAIRAFAGSADPARWLLPLLRHH